METETVNHPPPPSRSLSTGKPKGILKNAPPANTTPTGQQQQHLQWDEANIALTEIQKDSLMKITEPKTPFVRYNAETDTIEGEIPDLYLNGRKSPSSPEVLTSPLADDSAPSSRRTSISSSGRANSLPRSGSGQSSRSTSFSLPNEARGDIDVDQSAMGEEVEVGEEMDEEAAAKHAAFVRARGRHYSNEAEAMKRAAALMAQEDDEDIEDTTEDADMEDGAPPVPPVPKINGTSH